MAACCAVAMAQSESTVTAQVSPVSRSMESRLQGTPFRGTTIPPMYPGAPIWPLPAHCRVDGVIHRRKGTDARSSESLALAAGKERLEWRLHDAGGGGGNGVVSYPLGASYSGDKTALVRGFAVASTDTGHKAKTGHSTSHLCAISRRILISHIWQMPRWLEWRR